MSQPDGTLEEQFSVLDKLVKDSPSREEIRRRILEKLMGGITQEDARRIVYGKPKDKP